MLTGAASHAPVDWHRINWQTVHRNVRRLQARIVQATQAGRWGKVQALQHLLTHSFSGRALGRQTGDGKSWQSDPGGGWGNLAHPDEESSGALRVATTRVSPPSLATRVYP